MGKIRPEQYTSTSADEPLPPHIVGIECENTLEQDEDVGMWQYFSPEACQQAGITHHGQYLGAAGGAGRLYIDIGKHPEYATAEMRGPAAAVVAAWEGIDIMSRIIVASGLPHRGLYRNSRTFLPPMGERPFRIDETTGYHENIGVPTRVAVRRLTTVLVPTAQVSRVYAMAGMVDYTGFKPSQKMHAIGYPAVERLTGRRRTSRVAKPLLYFPPIQYESDIQGPDEDMVRGETRSGDPVLSLVASFAGTAAVVHAFRLVEQEPVFQKGELQKIGFEDTVAAGKRFGDDPTFTATARTIGGMTITALDSEELQLEKLRYLSERRQLPADELLAIDIRQALVDALRDEKSERAALKLEAMQSIDSVVRYFGLARAAKSDLISAHTDKVALLNLEWDRVLPAGPGYKYWQKVNERSPYAQRIRELAAAAGMSGRARFRAAIIDGAGPASTVDHWNSYTTKNGYSRSLGSVLAD
jgi:hypothetical protein